MSLVCRLSFAKIRLLKLKTALRILIISISISSSASAQSLNEYCLSTIGKIDTTTKTKEQNLTPQLPSFISSVENLPELYKKPCTKFYRFFWECDRKTFFSYSPTLNRVFIQGYRQTDWGRDFAHLEISESGTKSVPEPLINSDFAEDIPKLNGVLFRGDLKGDALFYDGNKVTNLYNRFPKLKKNTLPHSWLYSETSEGRVFLAVDFVDAKGTPFLIELIPELRFKFISVPEELENATWLQLYTLPDNLQLWGVSRNILLAEIGNTLKSIAIIPPSFFINRSKYTGQLVNGSIQFQIQHRETKSTTNYFLRQASAKANCEIMLDANKPVLLKPEFKN